MGYFDPAYFDPTYFDTGAATVSGSVRRALVVDFTERPDELNDEEAVLILLEVL